MKYAVYQFLYRSTDLKEFIFRSVGPKGEIDIVVQFNETPDPNATHLSFGNKLPDGSLDDFVKNDNSDRNTILATVAAAVFEYTATYPEKTVVFAGSTPSRTRLYRMAITINFEELISSHVLFGLQHVGLRFTSEKFIKGKSYAGFGVKRK